MTQLDTPDIAAGQGIARNALFLLVAKAVTTVISFFLVLYLARSLGDIHFGKYSFAIAYCGFFTVLVDLGLNNLAVRDLARDKRTAGDYLGVLVTLRLALSLVTLAVAFVVVNLLQYPPDTRLVVYVMGVGMLLISGFGELYTNVFEGYEQMQYIALIDTVKRTIDLGCAVVVLSLGYGLLVLVVAFLASESLRLGLSWWVARRRLGLRIRPHIDLEAWRTRIATAFPFALMLTFMAILTNTDIMMLAKMRGEQEVGWYGAASRLTSTLTLIPMMCATAMFPVASRLYHESREAVRPLFVGLVRPMIILGLPIAVGTSLLVRPLILLLYGLQYVPAAAALRLLVWAVAFSFINLPMVLLLTAIDRQRFGTVAMGISAGLNVVFNAALIPSLGLVGASLATVIAAAALFVCCATAVTTAFRGLVIHRYFIHPVIGSAVMGGIVWTMAAENVFFAIGVGAVGYGMVLLVTGALKREDWQTFRQFLTEVKRSK
ncbi:MAG: flippase [Candidatus Latescibacteria bacterium]|nr:flippase [Candidatus Latescibacterota bacterium]